MEAGVKEELYLTRRKEKRENYIRNKKSSHLSAEELMKKTGLLPACKGSQRVIGGELNMAPKGPESLSSTEK